MTNDDRLQNGLERQALIMGAIAMLAPLEKKEAVIQVGRMIDELVAAVVVDNLRKAGTPELCQTLIIQFRAAYQDRWTPGPERWKEVEKLL